MGSRCTQQESAKWHSSTTQRLMVVTYDTGVLVAADRGQRRMWARHQACSPTEKSRPCPLP